MTTEKTPTCALNLSPAVLSAWRDEALGPAAMQRTSAHIATCPTCQATLASYEAVASALALAHAPRPDARLWRAVESRIQQAKQRAGRSEGHQRHTPWASLGAVAAMLLLVAGFAQVFIFASLNQPLLTVPWQQETLPVGLILPDTTNPWPVSSLAVARNSAGVAYLCSIPRTGADTGHARVWVTHDGAAHWTPLTQIPANVTVYSCAVTVDDADTERVVVSVSTVENHAIGAQGPPLPNDALTFASADGGASWQQLAGDERFLIAQLATYQGVTYALRTTEYPVQSTGGTIRQLTHDLAISVDGLHTWKHIDAGTLAPGRAIMSFRVIPTTGEVLAVTRDDAATASTPAQLWSTRDRGLHWQRLPAPAAAIFVIQASAAGGAPLICGATYIEPQPEWPSALACSADDGQTWAARPLPPHASYPNPKHPGQSLRATTIPVAIADDGALLVQTSPIYDRARLYRLPATSDRWQQLGVLPPNNGINATVAYTSGQQGGLLWTFRIDVDLFFPLSPIFTAYYDDIGKRLPAPTVTPIATVAPSPTVSATPLPAHPLAWQMVASPPGFTLREIGADTLVVAPGDGRHAYACTSNSPQGTRAAYTLWTSADSGMHWAKTPSQPALQPADQCVLAVDALDPARAVVSLMLDNAQAPTTTYVAYTTLDGGASWQLLTGTQGGVTQIITVRGATYLLLNTATTAHIEVSTDGLRSWHTADADILRPTASDTSGERISRLWGNPYTGELLALALAGGSPKQPSLWSSVDGGQHWSRIAAQLNAEYAVQPAGTVWRFCAYVYAGGPDAAHPDQVQCATTSTPQQPTTRPGLTSALAASPRAVVGIAGDGALLAIGSTPNTLCCKSGASHELYRLPADASQWQDLGPLPEFTATLAATPGTGMLWSLPAVGIILDQQQRFYTATLPQ